MQSHRTRLDGELRRREARRDRARDIKLDVQGFECRALQGALHSLLGSFALQAIMAEAEYLSTRPTSYMYAQCRLRWYAM